MARILNLAEIDAILSEVRAEMIRAAAKHKAMASGHEGYAVILEELEELWDEVKADRGMEVEARKEAVQVAAMAVRYVYDLLTPHGTLAVAQRQETAGGLGDHGPNCGCHYCT